MKRNGIKFLLLALPALLISQGDILVIDGIAAIVDDNIILKSDVAQMAQMTAIQQRIDPQAEPQKMLQLQNDILQSMIDQKIILEMAKIDSIEVKDKEVDQALEQYFDNIIAQAGSEEEAEKILGQSLKSLRREYWEDMQDRLITDRYQQQLLSSIKVSRQEINDFFETYKDSLSYFPTQVHLWHLLTTVEAGSASQEKALADIQNLREKIIAGEPFEEMAQKYSQDPGSARNGGSLGFVRRGSLVPEFEAVAFTLADSEISQPVKTQFGYHLIQTLQKQGEKILVRHILTKPEITDEDEISAYNFALALHDSISSLDGFTRLAKKYSQDDKTRGLGGDLGWIVPQEFPIPEVAQIINQLELNECSRPVKTSFGYHLFWIQDIKPGGKPNLTTHWSTIETMALNYKKMNWYNNWIAKARTRFFIEILE